LDLVEAPALLSDHLLLEGQIEMKKTISLVTKFVLIVLSLTVSALPASAQNSPESQSANNLQKTNTRILYHDGPVRTNAQNLYFIFYGCWTNTCGIAGDTTTINILTEFSATVGNTPYMTINSTYTDGSGHPASAGLVYAGMVVDSWYAHGNQLTKSDIEGIISDQILSFALPQDPQGIYVVVASADIASTATGFCVPGAKPFHSSAIINGGLLSYVFLGNPNRCAVVAGPQFTGGPTPNGSFAGDALVANFAHALNGLLTNPYGNGWYDRYGLENADKCAQTFGQTYTTGNGARANIHLGQRDFLLEENWVNGRKASCAMSL